MAVTPRDAASLILFRGEGPAPEVLLGRRAETMRFMPGFYVFPGGAVDEEDAATGSGLPIHSATRISLERHANPARLGAFLWTCLRETFEETGLLYGEPGVWTAPSDCAVAAHYAAAGIAPGADRLELIARAITPKESPIRFDSRFFLADGSLLQGEIRPSEELQDVSWQRVDLAIAGLPMADVTRFMLARSLAIWCSQDGHAPAEWAIPIFTYSEGAFMLMGEEEARTAGVTVDLPHLKQPAQK